jgi:hypothetical protein
MKVLDLRCANGHGFEGWFASDEDYMSQNGSGLIACPLCADAVISRMPSAPRLNLSGAREVPLPASPAPASSAASAAAPAAQPRSASTGSPAAELQAAWLVAVRQVIRSTEDVGPRFAEEVRRIHYGETPHRGIRGQATAEEREALHEEGIETLAIAMPRGLEGPLQ